MENRLATGLTNLEMNLNKAKFVVEPVYWEGWQHCFIAATGAIIVAYEFLGRDTSRYRAELEQTIRQVKIRTLNTIAASFDFQSETFPWDDVPELLSPSGSVEALLAIGTPISQEQQVIRKEITNRIGMEFVLIPARDFLMGSVYGESNERPVHKVTISQSFYLGKYPVTQAQWEAVMGENPSGFTGDPHRPVENVSWEGVQKFIQWLQAGESGVTYRLPTEAEWEYACRAGSTTAYSFGDDPMQLGDYAWYEENSGEITHPVGTRKPNTWGLYDMHGNMWEWVQDRYAEDYYQSSSTVDPQGTDAGTHRVLRGGSWYHSAQYARSARRNWLRPDRSDPGSGFRCLSSGVSQ